MSRANSWRKIYNKDKRGDIEFPIFNIRDDILCKESLERFIKANGFYAVSRDRTYADIKWFLHNGRNVATRKYGNRPVDDQLEKFINCCMYREYYFKTPIGECVYVAFPNNWKGNNLEPLVQEWAKKYEVKAVVYNNQHSFIKSKEVFHQMIVVSLPRTDVVVQP